MYRTLATLTDGDRREALLELAAIEDRHAAHWMALLHAAGVAIPQDPGELSTDDAAVVARARQLGLDAVLSDLEQAERDASGMYDDEPDALPAMSDDEREHAAVLQGLSSAPVVRTPEDVRGQLNNAEPWHRTDKSGALRAAIFGVSDGWSPTPRWSWASAGTGVGGSTVLFAGFAGLLAGAFPWRLENT